MLDIIKANLPALQVVVPLVAAPVCAMLGRGDRSWAFATLVSFLTFAISVSLFVAAYGGEPISYEMGSWAPPIGIEYRVDGLNAFVLLIVSGIAALVTALCPPQRCCGNPG